MRKIVFEMVRFHVVLEETFVTWVPCQGKPSTQKDSFEKTAFEIFLFFVERGQIMKLARRFLCTAISILIIRRFLWEHFLFFLDWRTNLALSSKIHPSRLGRFLLCTSPGRDVFHAADGRFSSVTVWAATNLFCSRQAFQLPSNYLSPEMFAEKQKQKNMKFQKNQRHFPVKTAEFVMSPDDVLKKTKRNVLELKTYITSGSYCFPHRWV